jgi:predicted nuclease with TOPRIM domain
MKCDHLIGRTFDGEVYILASDVMEAIAELKADYHAEVEEVCVEKTNVDTLEQVLKEKDKALGEKDALLNDFREMQRQLAEKCGRLEDAIDKKDDEIAELKAKLESVQASMHCDVVDANMENRRLKRAFYKACANWAHFAIAFFSTYAIKDRWYKMERRCLKKAEEYK